MTPSVTISVLAYRTLESIERCLLSCVRLERPGPIQLVVREQGQDDAEAAVIAAFLREHGSGIDTQFERGPNLGFAAGHNRAIDRTASDFVLVLNADAVLEPDFLTEALPAFTDADVGAVQGKLTRTSGAETTIDTAGLVPRPDRSVMNRGQGHPDGGDYDEPCDVFGADGAAALYRRQALEDVAVPRFVFSTQPGVEYFDESFFAYKEDVDLAWRMQWRGWRTRYRPSAAGQHSRTGRAAVNTSLRAAVRERRAVPADRAALGFTNHRLMQLKNEDRRRLARDWKPWLRRELATWAFAALSPVTQARAAGRMARLAPLALRKRAWIQHGRQPAADPYRWFGAADAQPAASS